MPALPDPGRDLPVPHFGSMNGDAIRSTDRLKSSGSKITCVVPSRYGVFSARRTSPPSISDSLSVATGGLET
jgi:hypothetical protein